MPPPTPALAEAQVLSNPAPLSSSPGHLLPTRQLPQWHCGVKLWMSHAPSLLAIILPADLKDPCINKTNHAGRTAANPTLSKCWGFP